VTPEILEQEREIYRAQASASGKPAEVIEKMVTGRMEKYYEEFCLLEQPFVKNTDQTVGALLTEKVAKLGRTCACAASRASLWAKASRSSDGRGGRGPARGSSGRDADTHGARDRPDGFGRP
jgi:hypothetical protein